jgi:hypothetical protein
MEGVKLDKQPCQFHYWHVIGVTRQAEEALQLKKYLRRRYDHYAILARACIPSISHLMVASAPGVRKAGSTGDNHMPAVLDLQPGELVEVRSEEEILATLDKNGRYTGLYFMPDMKKFCGKQYRVYRKVEKIMLETTCELRRLVSPTVFLEGVYCDGTSHGGCDRSCFCFWREAWLKRVDS